MMMIWYDDDDDDDDDDDNDDDDDDMIWYDMIHYDWEDPCILTTNYHKIFFFQFELEISITYGYANKVDIR